MIDDGRLEPSFFVHNASANALDAGDGTLGLLKLMLNLIKSVCASCRGKLS